MHAAQDDDTSSYPAPRPSRTALWTSIGGVVTLAVALGGWTWIQALNESARTIWIDQGRPEPVDLHAEYLKAEPFLTARYQAPIDPGIVGGEFEAHCALDRVFHQGFVAHERGDFKLACLSYGHVAAEGAFGSYRYRHLVLAWRKDAEERRPPRK